MKDMAKRLLFVVQIVADFEKNFSRLSLLFGKVKVALQTVQSCNFYWSMWCVIWSTVDGCKRYCIEWFTDMYLLTPSNRVFVPFTLYQIIQVNHFVKLSWSQKQSIFHWSMHCNLTHLCFIKALCGSLHGLCGHLQKTSYNPCHEWKGTWSTLSCVMSLHWMNDLRFYDFFVGQEEGKEVTINSCELNTCSHISSFVVNLIFIC